MSFVIYYIEYVIHNLFFIISIKRAFNSVTSLIFIKKLPFKTSDMFLVAALFAAFVALLTLALLFMYWYMSLQELKGVNRKSVFITGCDTGFGNLLAKTLDRKGLRVFAGCLTEEGAAKLRSETSSRLRTVIVNITQADTIQRAYEFVKTHLDEDGAFLLTQFLIPNSR